MTKTIPAAKSEGLRKPQLRILAALAKSKTALSRAEISEKAEVDRAFCTEYIGSGDDAIRAKNDKKFLSLISLGFVKSADSEGLAVYSNTAAGKKAIAKG